MARRLVLIVAAGLAGVAAAVVVQESLASVQLDYFRARALSGSPGVQVTWHTLNEFGTVGFELYRSTSEFEHGLRIDPGPGPIAGCGGCNTGEYYTYTDAILAGGPYYYWLVDVLRGGSLEFHLMDPPRPVVLPTATPLAPTPAAPTDTPPAQATDTPAGPADTATSAATSATASTPAASATAAPGSATRLATATTVAPTRSGTVTAGTATPGTATVGPEASITPAGAVDATATAWTEPSTPAASATGGGLRVAPALSATPEVLEPSPAATRAVVPPLASTALDLPPGATSVAPVATAVASPTRRSFATTAGDEREGVLKGQGLLLIAVALVGLAMLAGAAWRTLRAEPAVAAKTAAQSVTRSEPLDTASGKDRAG